MKRTDKIFKFKESTAYRGDNWSNYVRSGGLYQSFTAAELTPNGIPKNIIYLNSPPKGTLIVNGLFQMIVPSSDWQQLTPGRISPGYYYQDTIIEVVAYNKKTDQIMRVNFKLYSGLSLNGLRNTGAIAQFVLQTQEKFGEWVTEKVKQLSFGLVDIDISLDNVGLWLPSSIAISDAQSTLGEQKGTGLTQDSNAEEPKRPNNIIPLLMVGGGLATGLLPVSALGFYLLRRGQ